MTKILQNPLKTLKPNGVEPSTLSIRIKMDKKIKAGFEKVKKVANKEEKYLVKEDIKRDKKCDMAEKKSKKRK